MCECNAQSDSVLIGTRSSQKATEKQSKSSTKTVEQQTKNNHKQECPYLSSQACLARPTTTVGGQDNNFKASSGVIHCELVRTLHP